MGDTAGALEDATKALTLAPNYHEVSLIVMNIQVQRSHPLSWKHGI